MKWRNVDVLVEQFRMNCVTRRNKHYAAQICQAIYFYGSDMQLELTVSASMLNGQNNNDDDGERKYGLWNGIA